MRTRFSSLREARFLNEDALFWILLASNILLSYFSLPLSLKLGLFAFGVLLPLGWRLIQIGPKASGFSPSGTQELFPPIPPWAWILLGLGTILLHLYRLTTLSSWPLYDEGMYAHYALTLFRGGEDPFFFGPSQAPPLYLWLLEGMFKIGGPSLFTLWLLPALLSSLLFPAAYWAARGAFNRSFSLLLSLLFGFSFWPLYLGRLGLMTGLVLLLECLTLGFLGRWVNEKDPRKCPPKAGALGAVLGIGFYTYLHWPALAFLVVLIFFLQARLRGSSQRFQGWKNILCFFGTFGLFLFPLGFFALQKGTSQLFFYLSHLSALSQSLPWREQLSVSSSYVASLFWGMDLKYHTYQPVWGGYLNPLLGGFFFLGLLEVFRRLKKGPALWFLTALVLFILPGALTSERATSRLILAFPILGILVVWGFQALWRENKGKKILFLCLGLASLILDLWHLGSVYPSLWKNLDHWKGYGKSYARYQAFLELEKIAEKRGPGLVLDDFVPGLSDKTLEVACFPFNLGENSRLKPGPAPWTAVLAGADYLPFLKKEFPDGLGWPLGKNLGIADGGWMLWVMPMDPSRIARLQRWLKAEDALSPFLEANLRYVPGQSFKGIKAALRGAYPAFQGDPFLESCYWEKMADLCLREALGNPATGQAPDLTEPLHCLIQAVQKGYPAAHLYYHEAILSLMEGHKIEARRAFQHTLKAPLNLTDAEKILMTLK